MNVNISFFVLTKSIGGSLIEPAWIEDTTRPISRRACDVKSIEITLSEIDRMVSVMMMGWINKKVWSCRVSYSFIQSVRDYNFFCSHPESNNERSYAYIAQYQSGLPIKRVQKKDQCGGNGNAGCKGRFSCCNHVLVKLVYLAPCYAYRLAKFFADLHRILIFLVLKIPPVQGQTRQNEGKKTQRRTVSRFKSDECGQKSNKNWDKKTLEPIKNNLLRNDRSFLQSRRIFFYISFIGHFLTRPFTSYFLTKNIFNHRDKINKTQENCACGFFNNSSIKEILS